VHGSIAVPAPATCLVKTPGASGAYKSLRARPGLTQLMPPGCARAGAGERPCLRLAVSVLLRCQADCGCSKHSQHTPAHGSLYAWNMACLLSGMLCRGHVP